MEKNYIGYIYCIENKINGNKYIGQTIQSIERRFTQHCSTAKSKENHNSPICYAINKYGKENFLLYELQKIYADSTEELKDLLNEAEIQYIKKYNTYLGKGYNATPGGDSSSVLNQKPVDVYYIDGVFIESLESRMDVSKKYGVCTDVINNICSGKVANYQCKYVFRNKGDLFNKHDITSSYYKKIYRFDLDGNNMKIFYSNQQALESVNAKYISAIMLIIDNPHAQSFGYWWSSSPIFNYKGKKNKKSVDLYDLNLNYLMTFDTVTSCAKYLDTKASNVSDVCKGKTGIIKKHFVRYAGEDIFKYKPNITQSNTIREIDRYDLQGNFIKTYKSATEAGIDIGDKKFCHNILNCCRGESQTAYKQIWRFHGDNLNIYNISFIHFGTEVQIDQYDLNGNYIKTWDSIIEAAHYYEHKNGSFIRSVCCGIKRQAYGFVWRYKGDSFDKYRVDQIKLKAINQYNLNFEYIKTWNSVSEIKKYYNYNSDSKIYRNLRKETKYCDDMILFYASDPDQPDKSKIIPSVTKTAE